MNDDGMRAAVARAVDAFPPLTQEQLARIAVLMGYEPPAPATSGRRTRRPMSRSDSRSGEAPGPAPTSSPYLTTDEVAARFRTSVRTVTYWREQRCGPKGVRFGKRVLYKISDVETWEQARADADDLASE